MKGDSTSYIWTSPQHALITGAVLAALAMQGARSDGVPWTVQPVMTENEDYTAQITLDTGTKKFRVIVTEVE